METALNDVALRPAIDRFFFFVLAVEVKKKGQHATTANHCGPRLQSVDPKSKSYAKAPTLEHTNELEVFPPTGSQRLCRLMWRRW